MPKNNLVSFVDKEQTPGFDGNVHYKNPKWFYGEVPSWATHFITDDEKIAQIYESKGVKRYESQSTSKPKPSGVSTSVQPESSPSDEAGQQRTEATQPNSQRLQVDGVQQEEKGQREEKEVVSIPEDWESLPFFSQKAIASRLTDETVRTKEDVQKVIRANL